MAQTIYHSIQIIHFLKMHICQFLLDYIHMKILVTLMILSILQNKAKKRN